MYVGNKQLDAEIEINIEDGIIKMDYVNSFFKGANIDSNTLHTISSKKLTKNKWKIFFYELLNVPPWFLYYHLGNLGLQLFSLFTKDTFKKTWSKYNIQYKYQKALVKLEFLNKGYVIEKHTGPYCSKILTFYIPNNLFFEYNLTGDYQKYISKISLKRRYVTIRTLVEERVQQDGWNVIFLFKEIPTYGKVEIKHV